MAFRIGEDAVRGSAGQRRQGVDRGVAPQLVPDGAADVVAGVAADAGIFEHRLEHADAITGATTRIADNQLVGVLDHDLVRRGTETGGVDDAADDPLDRQRGANGAGRIDRAQWLTVNEPPGHAVEHRQDQRVGPDERPQLCRERRQRRRLYGDDEKLRRSLEPVEADASGLVGLRNLDGVERPSTGQRHHGLTGKRELRRDPTADRSGTNDADVHRDGDGLNGLGSARGKRA